MATAQKFVVLPFKRARAGIVPVEMRQASNAASAERIAASMASRFLGVVALSAMADNETGDLTEARLLASYGEIGDLSAIVEFSLEQEAKLEPEKELAEETPQLETLVSLDDEGEPPGVKPLELPLATNASSLILTAPPQPVSTRRAPASTTRHPKPAAASAGPLFEQESINA